MAQISETMLIDQVVERLSTRYTDVAPDRVADVVHTAHARFEHSSIREFVPLLVERRASDELARDTELLVAAR
ncbi:three-helix bundle dimerization domain-containing protein [Mycolicibacterium thermoresistibile]